MRGVVDRDQILERNSACNYIGSEGNVRKGTLGFYSIYKLDL
jgi:hypothetical protein